MDLHSSVRAALESQQTSTKAALFLSMDKNLVLKILNAMESRTYNKGDVVIKRGDPHREMMIIEEGELEKLFPMITPGNGREQRVPLKRGEVVGLLHFFAEDKSGSEIVCNKDGTRVLALSGAKFREMMAADSNLSSAFVTLLSRRLRREMGVMRSLGTFLDEKSKKDEGKSKFHVTFFDRKGYFKAAFDAVAAKDGCNEWMTMSWFDSLLTPSTAPLASGSQAVCCFVNDDLSASVLAALAEHQVGLIALRCAGYDNVDLSTVKSLNLSITRVPAYSPTAVAEFAITLLLSLNRKVHKATDRVRAFNFSIEGLVGFDLRGKTVGIFGTGKIGFLTAQIYLGFGCKVLATDIYENAELKQQGVRYVTKEQLLREVDVLSIHAPLTDSTRHWLDAAALKMMKRTSLVINTSRGPLIDTEALLNAILEERIGGAALDVIEGEGAYFFRDRSDTVAVANSTMARLISCPNVILTGHQAFLTHEALENIAQSTLNSIKEYAKDGKRGDKLTNAVKEQY